LLHSAYERDVKENAHKVKLYLPRKAAPLLEEYYNTGAITPSQLIPRETPNPGIGAIELLEEYLDFGRSEMNYSAGSLMNRRNTIRRYLLAAERLGHNDLMEMTLPDAKRSMMEYLQLGSGKTHMLYPIRDFLKFLYGNKVTAQDLSIVVPRNYSPKRHIKEGYSGGEIDALLNSVNRETPLGKRDYAAMLLAQTTGLRGSMLSLKILGYRLEAEGN
jgi:site-specific recombinase XerD